MSTKWHVSLFTTATVAAVLAVAGCSSSAGPDPAAANLEPADRTAVSQSAAQAQYAPPPEANYAASDYQPAEEQLVEAPQPPPPLPEYSQPELSRRRLHLDTGLLELFARRLLLGSGRVGAGALH